MKLIEAINFMDIWQVIKDQTMPIRLAYKFDRLIRRIEQEQRFYREKVQEIIDKYVLKDEDGHPIMTEDGQGMKLRVGTEEECDKAMEELQQLDVEIAPDFTLDELENLELTPAQMHILMPYIIG